MRANDEPWTEQIDRFVAGKAPRSVAELHIGRDVSNTARDWNGWIGGIRLTKGASRELASMTFSFSNPRPA